jgi:hypothetical protein
MGGKLEDAVQRAVGWDQLGSTVARAKGLFRGDPNDRAALLMAEHTSVRRLGPRLLASFRFHGAPACQPLLDAVHLLRDAKGGRGRSMPDDAPTAFVTVGWRRHVHRDDGSLDRRAYELCALSELNDRLRAGDVWVEGSRSYRAVDGLLIPRAALADLDARGTASPAVPIEAEAWIGARRQLLDRELRATARRLARAPAPDGQRLVRAFSGRARRGKTPAGQPWLRGSTPCCRRCGSPTCWRRWTAGPASSRSSGTCGPASPRRTDAPSWRR